MIVELLAARTEERLAMTGHNIRVRYALQGRLEPVGELAPFPGRRSHRMRMRSLPQAAS
jgi:hypothetical protein